MAKKKRSALNRIRQTQRRTTIKTVARSAARSAVKTARFACTATIPEIVRMETMRAKRSVVSAERNSDRSHG